ncbi:MAG: hypothetical protein NTX75_00420 [Proteobacteria bacterium]|nr:hypothetical protein [Pseudomonadota bacterium]
MRTYKSHRTTRTNTSTTPQQSCEVCERFKAIKQHWNVICHAYMIHDDKKPVMLLDVTEEMIYAYPYKDFKAQPSEHERASLTEQYKEGFQKNCFVIFVRDNEEKKLISYSMNLPEMCEPVSLDRCELT